MKVLGSLLVLALIVGLSPVVQACPHFTANVTCSPFSPSPDLRIWVITWNDPGAPHCCDSIVIQEQDDCTGSFVDLDKVKCSDEEYQRIAVPGQKVFRLKVYDDDGVLLDTYTTWCTECD